MAHEPEIHGKRFRCFETTVGLSRRLGYTHADYADFPNSVAYDQNLDPSSAAYGQFAASNIDATGFAVQRTPRFSGNLSGQYGVDLAGGQLNLNANVFYTSSFYFDASRQLKQPEYALINLRAVWTDPSRHLDFALYGKNVTGTKYYIANFIDTFANRAVYGAPMELGASITYGF